MKGNVGITSFFPLINRPCRLRCRAEKKKNPFKFKTLARKKPFHNKASKERARIRRTSCPFFAREMLFFFFVYDMFASRGKKTKIKHAESIHDSKKAPLPSVMAKRNFFSISSLVAY